MVCVLPVYLATAMCFLTIASSLPATSTPRVQSPQIGETIKEVTNQLMAINISTPEIALDTRTPPRVKQQQLNKKNEKEAMEKYHVGVAVPVDEETLLMDEATKKTHYYKVEKPTTDSGLSTWILLSGQSAPSTPKPTRKSVIKLNTTEANKNLTSIDVEILNKVVKPIFKKRPVTTTKKPTTVSSGSTTMISTTTNAAAEKTTKLTKIKASVLNNAVNNKNKTQNSTVKKQLTSTTSKPKTTTVVSTTVGGSSTTTGGSSTTSGLSTTNALSTTNVVKSTKEDVDNISLHETVPTVPTIESNDLPLEAKDGEVELSGTTQNPKKARRPNTSNKRKKTKGKNKTKKPNIDRNDKNVTNKINANLKEKPIGTQIYNYLSREVMPTVGVGLVGLMVTAGLASYFLYPFGTLRRSYEIDRKDKDGAYYYNDNHSGGVAEEEMIGKVIAGMPDTYFNSYSTRHGYPSLRYRKVDQRYNQYQTQPQGSVETVQITPNKNYNNDEHVVRDSYLSQGNYNPYYSKKDTVEPTKENEYQQNNQQFVVGNVPKELIQEVTPVAVPEHGPRFLRARKRRQIDEMENEIPVDEVPPKEEGSQAITSSTTESTTTKFTTKHTTTAAPPEERPSFLNVLKDLLNFKIRFGLELLQNTTQSFSRYLSRVQERLNNGHNS